MRWGQITEVGLVRPNNEDSFLICPETSLFVVADGMGGHQAGEVASSKALAIFEQELTKHLDANIAGKQAMLQALNHVNKQIYQMSLQDKLLRGMGTTITACLLQQHEALLAHVGDSRAYLLRDGTASQITNDHSLVGELVKSGSITEEIAQVHPRRNVLTQAVGVTETIKIDFYHVPILKGDQILLCTDGLSNHVKRKEITSIIENITDPQQAVRRLADAALEKGGTDNITLILIYL